MRYIYNIIEMNDKIKWTVEVITGDEILALFSNDITFG